MIQVRIGPYPALELTTETNWPIVITVGGTSIFIWKQEITVHYLGDVDSQTFNLAEALD